MALEDFNIHAEAPATGAAQDFRVTAITMQLSQYQPPYWVCTAGLEDGDLKVEIKITSSSWSDQYLVEFRFIGWPLRLMDPDRFLKSLGEFSCHYG